MTDVTDNEGFQPDEVEATRGREQGLGVGERELERQRDVGDIVAAPEEERDFQSAAQDAEDDTAYAADRDIAVRGDDETLDDADDEVVEDDEP